MAQKINEGEFLHIPGEGDFKAVIVTNYLASFYDNDRNIIDVPLDEVQLSEKTVVGRLIVKYTK